MANQSANKHREDAIKVIANLCMMEKLHEKVLFTVFWVISKRICCFFFIFFRKMESVFNANKPEDTTQLIITLRMTQIGGVMSLVYGMLLHSASPSRGQSPPLQYPQHTLILTEKCLKLLNHVALVDLKMLQVSL